MTTMFEERERGFERRFALEEEARFRLRNRRNHLLAAWVGERMGLPEPDAARFIAEFTDAGVVTGDGALLARIRAALEGAGITEAPERVATEMQRCDALAHAEIGSGQSLTP